MEMANNSKQTQQKSTEEVNIKMRRSFSWDRAFFTSDGFLAAEELSSMIEGGGDDVKHELQKIDELQSLEAKLFQEIEASIKKSTRTSNVTDSSINLSSGKKDFQPKKVTGAGDPHRDASIKTPLTRSTPGNNVKTLARKSMSSKTGKDNVNAPLKSPPAIRTKNKVESVNTRVSRTAPASPVSPGSPGSSSSTFDVKQRSKRSGGVPRISSVKNEKPSATDERRNDDRKASKPEVSLMPNTQSSISLKAKPPPVISHPSSSSGLFNSSSSSTTQRSSESSSSCTIDQRSKSRGIIGSTVHHISKPALKNHPTGKTSDPNRKQPAKTGAAANTGVKPTSPKTKKQSSPKAKASSENIFVISPELLDLKGKIKALKMEIDMHKDRCNKMVRAESNEGNLKTPFAIKECSL